MDATIHRQDCGAGARTRIHADPARAACRRRPCRTTHSAPRCWTPPVSMTRRVGAEIDLLLRTDHEMPALILRSMAASFGRRRAAICCARRRSCRPGAICTASIRSAFPASMPSGRRAPGRACSSGTPGRPGVPESVALVLWGTDNLKSEGGPIAQALGLLGARPRFDSYGRLAGAETDPARRDGRPRIDVIVTLSGIFRDLLPLQVKLLAEAAISPPPPTSRRR